MSACRARSRRATPRRAHEPGPQQQVLGRVARDGELGKRTRSARAARLLEPLEDQRAVAVEVADDGVDLRERYPHFLVLDYQSKTYS
jgi:hypothetical protein